MGGGKRGRDLVGEWKISCSTSRLLTEEGWCLTVGGGGGISCDLQRTKPQKTTIVFHDTILPMSLKKRGYRRLKIISHDLPEGVCLAEDETEDEAGSPSGLCCKLGTLYFLEFKI